MSKKRRIELVGMLVSLSGVHIALIADSLIAFAFAMGFLFFAMAFIWGGDE